MTNLYDIKICNGHIIVIQKNIKMPEHVIYCIYRNHNIMTMTLRQAIDARHSVRAYKDQPIETEKIAALRQKIDEINREANLHVQLITDEPKAFQGALAKYGKFRNVRNYIVMAGRKTDSLNERIGYYGEQLVLFAQTLGLNTCWVGLSYSKIPGTYQLRDDEKIACYIAIGYGETQGAGHKIKSPEQVSNVSATSPEWFSKGVEAALLAPTAINQQKFHFDYEANAEGLPHVKARKGFSLVGYTEIDLGIAKCHFEIGAGKDNFEWE